MSDRYFFSEVIFIMRPQREPTISILFDHSFLLEETDTQITFSAPPLKPIW